MNGWDLKGKRVVVTGGTKGIGEAVAREFESLGAEVLVTARTTDADGRGMTADIASAADRARVAEEVERRWGALDILVNNAGTNIRKPWVEMDQEEQAIVMGTNLLGPADLARRLFPLLRKGAAPAVVNVASVAAFVDVGSGAAYAMGKAALLQLTRSLAVEWAPHGIRVNAVAPWYVRTPLTQPVLSRPERLERILARTPMKRVGEPREIAAAVAFLAMDKASFITGHCIVADGGLLSSGM